MELSHKKCSFCRSIDAFSYNTESGMFKCFSCDATPRSKGGVCKDGKTLEVFNQLEDDDGEVILDPYLPDNYRGILKKTFEKDGLCYFTKTDKGEVANFTYPNATKYRRLYLPKDDKYHFQSQGKLDRLMGIENYTTGGKFITVTEGEWDRYSVMQIMGDWPVVNVPGANPSKDFWSNTKKDLEGFEKIILSVDNDSKGNELAEKFYRLFPGKVYRVSHGKYKDANDFLI